jgi:hypothetical protein
MSSASASCVLYSCLLVAMIPQIDDKTLRLLNLLLPDFNPVIQPVEGSKVTGPHTCRLELPPAHGADYFFCLWFYPDGERQIGAKLVEVSDDARYFWYRPFELAEFRDSNEDLVNVFCEQLDALITHETRIIQRKGWLFWHFRCDYRASGNWKCLYRHSALRGGFKPAPIKGRKRVYGSPALTVKDSIK